jgi:outer membrane protein OmpA-like peptidoglycan-associated protein
MERHALWLFLAFGCALASAAAIAQTSSAPLTIRLCTGLTIVTAISQKEGDYESIKTIESVDAEAVHMKYSAEMKDSDIFSTGPAKLKNVAYRRTMLIKDLQSAHMYQQVFVDKSAETIPGTTSIGTSAAVLNDLKSKGEADFSISVAYPGLELGADRNKFPSYYHFMQGGKLKKVGAAQVSVVVNDKPADLPALQAQGDLLGKKVEFFFLDDQGNPLTLAFHLGVGEYKPLTPEQKKFCEASKKGGLSPVGSDFRCDMPDGGARESLRVVKISCRCNGPAVMLAGATGAAGKLPNAEGGDSSGAKAMEEALIRDKKVDVYSIYFSFNSDILRDESQPTLKDIAEVMRRHPDWKLQVNGHTDAVGGDQFNLDLSKRRAAAVKNALVQQYKIGGDRFATAGYGKSQPKDTNDTLEGRARNRRVELMRIS